MANSLELELHLKTCAACAGEKQAVHSLKTALRHSARAHVGWHNFDAIQPLLLWKSPAFGATAFAVLVILLRATPWPATSAR